MTGQTMTINNTEIDTEMNAELKPVISITCEKCSGFAYELANRLGLQMVPREEIGGNLALLVGHDGLTLSYKNMSFHPDLSKMVPRLKPPCLSKEFLVKAAKIRQNSEGRLPVALDATAGLGEDSILLAAAGFDVYMYERDPLIAALLEDSLKRALNTVELENIVSRMKLIYADSVPAMRLLELPASSVDVILLDPMFPEHIKNSAARKKAQLLRLLERPCEDELELLESAKAVKPKKIVIKRPLKGGWLANESPDYSIKGKSIRYDIFSFAQT